MKKVWILISWLLMKPAGLDLHGFEKRDGILKMLCPLCAYKIKYEPVHEISNNVVCATSKASDQPVHTRSLIRAFASRLSVL